MSESVLPNGPQAGTLAVLRNRPFLLLWLSQVATQIGGNIILYALTFMVVDATDLSSAVSLLFLSYLVPSVLFSALAGVYVDRFDRKTVLIVTNVLRAVILVAIWAVGPNIGMLLLLNTVFATVTVFFAPAEASMIPFVVPREQLISANGLFTLTLNAAFAVGYALLGPILVTVAGSPEPIVLLVAVLFGVAAVFCLTLPSDPPVRREGESPFAAIGEGAQAVGGTFGQLREGMTYIRSNPTVGWALFYLGIAASLIGVVGVLGPKFATQTLGLDAKGLVVVVLPLGIGIAMGIMLLNAYGRYFPRRRLIEIGLIALGILLITLTVAGPLSRFLTGVGEGVKNVDLSMLTSLIGVVVALAFLAGIAYGVVAICSQTQLQEELPEDVRGRVFGVLNMLVSVASILPLIIVGPIADLIGTTAVILAVAVMVLLAGLASRAIRGHLSPEERLAVAGRIPDATLDPIGMARHAADESHLRNPGDPGPEGR